MNKGPAVRVALTGCLLLILLSLSARGASAAQEAAGKHREIHKHKNKHRHSHRHSHKAKTPVHRDAGQAPAVRIGRASPSVYGPFQPAEAYLYPQLPCPEADAALEARVHEEGPASSEGQVEPAETAPAAEAGAARPAPAVGEAALAGIARRLDSLLRPKSRSARIKPQDVDLAELLSAKLLIPVAGADVERLRDSFLASRGRYRKHLAIDIGAPRGTPVLATSDGEIVKTPRERRGGRTIYMKDPSGQYLIYYAHLCRYAPGIAAGRRVAKGEVIGYIGSTGHVVGGPHLHFSIARVPGDEDTQREGLAVNPYLLFLASVP